MDKDRIHRAAIGKAGLGRRASDVNQRMGRRIKAYAVAIVLLGGWYVLQGPGDEPPPEVSEHSMPPLDTPEVDDTPLAQVDRELMASVRDGSLAERAVLEGPAREHLMTQAGRLIYGDLQKLGLEPGDWPTLVAGAAERRGDPFWVLGTLSWMETERIDGRFQVRGEVADRDGHPWGFLVLSQPFDVQPGDVVKLAGFYMKAHELLRPDGSLVTVPLLVGDELLRSAFPIDPVTALHPRALENVRDFDITQASRPLDSPAFYELLSFVDNAAVADVLPPGDVPEVLPTQLLSASGDWRGRPVEVTGVLVLATQRPLGPRGENPLQIPFVQQLWVSDNRAGEAGTMLVLSLTEPPAVEPGQILTVRGRFFRRYAFENKANKPRMCAVILAREIEVFVPPPNTLTPLLVQIIMGLVALVGAGIVLGQVLERRSASTARKARMRRHRGNVARPGRLSAGNGGSGNGGSGDGGSDAGTPAAHEAVKDGGAANSGPATGTE